VFDCTSCDP